MVSEHNVYGSTFRRALSYNEVVHKAKLLCMYRRMRVELKWQNMGYIFMLYFVLASVSLSNKHYTYSTS